MKRFTGRFVLQGSQAAEFVQYPIRKVLQRSVVGNSAVKDNEAVFHGDERVERAVEVRMDVGLFLLVCPLQYAR